MPRGVRKRSQFRVTIWTPKGGKVDEWTTKDLDRQHFIACLREQAQKLQRIADNLEKNGDA